jgi:very-short-patch-repair endonuclease
MSLPLPTRRGDLLAVGVPATTLDNDVRARRTTSVFRGVHVGTDALGPAARRRAALLTQAPSAVLSHRSAAVVHGLRWLPGAWFDLGATIHVTVPPADKHRQRVGLVLHRSALDPADIVAVNAEPCTSRARTLVDLARSGEPRLLMVQILDGELGRGCSLEQLHAELDRLAGQRGIRSARERVREARCGVDSPQETELRLILCDGVVTGARPDVRIHDETGHVIARGDLCDPDLMLWGEYDGYDVHSQRATFRGDRAGDRWLERRGWHVMRFTDADLRRPGAVVREWTWAQRNAPMRIAAMSPDRSPELAAAQRKLRWPPGNAEPGAAGSWQRRSRG